MNRLFGTRSSAPKASLGDALNNIDERISSLDVKISKLNSELTTYQQKLSRMRDGPGKNSVKQRALKLLRQRKQLEAQKDQLMSQSWNISQAQMTTDNLKNTMITVDAMKRSNKELRKTYGKIDVDKLEDMQDEMIDLMDQSNEIQDALGRSYDVPDDVSESELDAELEALGDEVEANGELEGESMPSYLTDSAIGADTDKLPNFIDEDQTDAEKKEMVAQ
ncbi:DEKNAAC100657 [Brettanomyces naardenensis]|uniref:DEKNAAC100657 n=1 Tax=Brettanomyces naardenensis TaxID=13370 RepID=A0A448YGD9_BRENA|nr:DEKNAAC100657 [Brettanomyces naardenensis]